MVHTMFIAAAAKSDLRPSCGRVRKLAVTAAKTHWHVMLCAQQVTEMLVRTDNSILQLLPLPAQQQYN